MFKKISLKKSHTAENESFSPLPIFLTCETLKPVLIHCRLIFPILIHYRTHSDYAQIRKVVGSQWESRTKTLKLRYPIRLEYYVTQKHPKALSYNGGPFLDSAQVGLLEAILLYKGLPTPVRSGHFYTTYLLFSFLTLLFYFCNVLIFSKFLTCT